MLVCALLDSAPLVYQEFRSTDMKYKSRLRSRISNLKDQKNPDLRRNVLCGNISPQQIATMRAEVGLADYWLSWGTDSLSVSVSLSVSDLAASIYPSVWLIIIEDTIFPLVPSRLSVCLSVQSF